MTAHSQKPLIGPLKTIAPPRDEMKFEAVCHLCKWTFFKWTVDEARAFLLRHIDETHVNPPDRPEPLPGLPW